MSDKLAIGTLVGLLSYVTIFGVNVNLTSTETSVIPAECQSITAPVIKTPPVMGIIPEDNLSDSAYVVQKLIRHIKKQNEYIDEQNQQVSKQYRAYSNCIPETIATSSED